MVHTAPDAEYGRDEEYVPVQAKAGDLLLIDGLVVHRSAPNRSLQPRPVYTFHIFDRKGRKWDPSNWLQPSAELDFKSLYVWYVVGVIFLTKGYLINIAIGAYFTNLNIN